MADKPDLTRASVDKLMNRIYEELKICSLADLSSRDCRLQRESEDVPADHLMTSGLIKIPTPQAPKDFQGREGYQLKDFMKYHDREFIARAYEGVLRRPPDPTGYDYYLQRLRNGKLSKVEILGRLRYAREGRSKSVRVRWLLLTLALHTSFRIPILGHLIRFATAIVKLPSTLRTTETNNSHFHAALADISSRLELCFNTIETLSNSKVEKSDVVPHIEQLHAALAEISSGLQLLSTRVQTLSASKVERSEFDSYVDLLHSSRAHRFEQEDLLKRLDALQATTSIEVSSIQQSLSELRRQINNHKLNILDQQRRVMLLFHEVRKRLPAPMSHTDIQEFLNEEEHLLDAFYATFEDVFRGTRAEIKNRQRIYLSYIHEIQPSGGNPTILDLGCGRGEWLELLRENGFLALGVDRNRVMIRRCEEMGLNVVESDFLDFLTTQNANTFSAITGFHIIEHLPLKKILLLFDEVFRALRPGGTFILETPNPQNILVGASNFYIDPTHTTPFFPSSLIFLLEHRGFSECILKKLHPMDALTIDPDMHCSVKKLISFFNESQDFGVICKKL